MLRLKKLIIAGVTLFSVSAAPFANAFAENAPCAPSVDSGIRGLYGEVCTALSEHGRQARLCHAGQVGAEEFTYAAKQEAEDALDDLIFSLEPDRGLPGPDLTDLHELRMRIEGNIMQTLSVEAACATGSF